MPLFRVPVLALIAATALAAPASAQWVEARSRHFVIYSQNGAEAVRRQAERLERFDAAVRKVRGSEDPDLTDGSRLTVFDLPTVTAVRAMMPPGSRVSGFYIPRASGANAFVSLRERLPSAADNPDHILQHEYTHHLMLTEASSPLAAWLVEGVAEFFGTAVVEPDGGVKIGYPPISRRTAIVRDLGLSAGDLLSGASPTQDLARSSLYAKGWLLTHYLAFNPKRTGQLDRYVSLLSRGDRPAVAATAAFGDLRQLDREIDIYGQGIFPAIRVNPGAAPTVAVRALGAGENAIMPVRIRVERGLRPADVPAVAEQARAIAAQYPADPAVQAVLAEVEVAAGRWWPAVTAADRALAADPKNVGAMITKGRALFAEARGKGAEADWREVRKWLLQANRADTENAQPLFLYYRSFAAGGQQPTPDAIKGLYYAFLLAPHDVALRMSVVRQRLVDGDLAAAIRDFAPVVANPHLDLARRPDLPLAMEAMRKGDAKAAIAALDADRTRSGTATEV